MDLQLAGRSVLVTGGTRGIGRAIAVAYAAEGARVAITYANDPDAASRTVDEIRELGAEGLAVPLDLEDPGSISSAVDTTVRAHGAWTWSSRTRCAGPEMRAGGSPRPTPPRGAARWRRTSRGPSLPRGRRFNVSPGLSMGASS